MGTDFWWFSHRARRSMAYPPERVGVLLHLQSLLLGFSRSGKNHGTRWEHVVHVSGLKKWQRVWAATRLAPTGSYLRAFVLSEQTLCTEKTFSTSFMRTCGGSGMMSRCLGFFPCHPVCQCDVFEIVMNIYNHKRLWCLSIYGMDIIGDTL